MVAPPPPDMYYNVPTPDLMMRAQPPRRPRRRSRSRRSRRSPRLAGGGLACKRRRLRRRSLACSGSWRGWRRRRLRPMRWRTRRAVAALGGRTPGDRSGGCWGLRRRPTQLAGTIARMRRMIPAHDIARTVELPRPPEALPALGGTERCDGVPLGASCKAICPPRSCWERRRSCSRLQTRWRPRRRQRQRRWQAQ
jgi:hypothetical protein